MTKIPSFQIDHEKLNPGVYVARQDRFDPKVVTTFDVRLKAPYRQTPLTPAVIHTLEHLGAVYLREHSSWADKVVYWGPKGCQTGFDLLIAGTWEAADAVSLLCELFLFIVNYKGPILGAEHPWQCGNYRLHDLQGAKREAQAFAEILSMWKKEDSEYPQHLGNTTFLGKMCP